MTLTVAREGDWCEVCERAIPAGDACYVFGIGGGWAEVCAPCGRKALRNRDAVEMPRNAESAP